MIVRHLFFLLGWLVFFPGHSFAVTETQSFASAASAATAGWAAENASSNGNQYGFSLTNFANGLSLGEAGGIVARAGVPSYFADLSLGGPNWSYTWDPVGGAFALGRLTVTIDGPGGGTSTLDVDSTFQNSTLSVDSFGVSSPALVNPDAQKRIEIYFDDLSYSEESGSSNVPALSAGWLAILFSLICMTAGTSKAFRSAEDAEDHRR